jgi:hypothetical protein
VRCFLGLLTLVALLLVVAPARGADAPKPAPAFVELTGTAEEYFSTRNWNSYYWREDFSFVLGEEGGRTWRILSRAPTPAWDWRMGPTYTGLAVDWKSKPRVRLAGVTGVDRQPAVFYDFKLDEPNLATAFVVWVETKPNEWREFYVNNWFHKWGDKVDRAVH